MSAHRTADATVSAHGAVAITKSDATIIPVTRAIYVGTTGDLAVRTADGQTITFKTVPVGVFPIQADMVMSTNTTAAEMIALY
jgi:hypothetical protein